MVKPRPSPDQLLRMVQAQEEHANRGSLKVFLGYASGVGKSFRMFDEGRRRLERGQDVVIGATQPNLPDTLECVLRVIEVIPPTGSGQRSEMNVDAILRRHPGVCLIDGLAHDNPPGSRNAHRWQDVEQLLGAGISVITTVNLQYVEERRQEVENIRGKRVSVTVPESFLHTADEIVVVDAPADEHTGGGELHGPSTERQQKLSRLREIALLLAADVVDKQLEEQIERSGSTHAWGMQERILVCLTPRTRADRMMERANLISKRFHGELYVVYVRQHDLTADDQAALERNFAIIREQGATIEVLEGEDPVKTIIDFAHSRGVTQIFVGHSLTTGWRARFTRTKVDNLIRAAEGIDVKLFPH